jgi:hypothetical protein
MRKLHFLRALTLAAAVSSSALMVACGDDDEETPGNGLGSITGTITDVSDGTTPVSGVTVTVSGVEATVTSGSDGKYTVENVSVESHTITFTKTGWETTSSSVAASKFDATTKVATVNASLRAADATITGTVLDGEHGDVPLAGVTVTLTEVASATATTNDNGEYSFVNLAADNYTINFAKAGYPSRSQSITKADFIGASKVATVNVTLGGSELLRGQTATDLASADVWSYNVYGGNDWSYNFIGTLQFYGQYQIQSEGAALQIRNDDVGQSNPADAEMFDSYLYGKKTITASSKTLTLWVRTHNATAEAPANFGVRVVDLNALTSTIVGETKTHGAEAYAAYSFDLSAYVGKEVVVAIGLYRVETGDYYKQLPIRRFVFSASAGDVDAGNDWPLSGTEVRFGWKLTQEALADLPVITTKLVTGIPGYYEDGDKTALFRTIREQGNHLATVWSFMSVYKDIEPHRTEGFIYKTRGSNGGGVNFDVPEAYLYGKFAIAAGNNSLELRARTFSGNPTYFKLTAIDAATFETTDITPAAEGPTYAGGDAGNGMWKYTSDGGPSDPDSYARFTYDLSSLNGKNVVIAIGVYKGEDNGDESKVCVYSLEMK